MDRENGKTEVKVHQLVRSLDGNILSDTELWHVYTIRNGLIERMDILEADGNTENRSAAFGLTAIEYCLLESVGFLRSGRPPAPC